MHTEWGTRKGRLDPRKVASILQNPIVTCVRYSPSFTLCLVKCVALSIFRQISFNPLWKLLVILIRGKKFLAYITQLADASLVSSSAHKPIIVITDPVSHAALSSWFVLICLLAGFLRFVSS